MKALSELSRHRIAHARRLKLSVRVPPSHCLLSLSLSFCRATLRGEPLAGGSPPTTSSASDMTARCRCAAVKARVCACGQWGSPLPLRLPYTLSSSARHDSAGRVLAGRAHSLSSCGSEDGPGRRTLAPLRHERRTPTIPRAKNEATSAGPPEQEEVAVIGAVPPPSCDTTTLLVLLLSAGRTLQASNHPPAAGAASSSLASSFRA